MANIFGFNDSGAAIVNGMGEFAKGLERMLGGADGDSLQVRDPAELKADLQRIKDVAKRIKKNTAAQLERRAAAAVEALLILNGMADRFCAIRVFGVDSFELVIDPEFDITLGELTTIGRTFETSAISMNVEYRWAEEPEREEEREFCPGCNDYHDIDRAIDPDFRRWEGERIVITIRGVGIDLQNPPV